MIKCEHCDYSIAFREMKRHLPQCTRAPTSCPNGCGVSTPKALLPQHDAHCALKVIEYPFALHGCSKRTMRKDMPGHVSAEAGAHTLLLSAEHAKKDRAIARLEKSLAEKDAALTMLSRRLTAMESAATSVRADVKDLKTSLEMDLGNIKGGPLKKTTATVKWKISNARRCVC